MTSENNNILFNDLYSQNQFVEDQILNGIKQLIKNSDFISGEIVYKFEQAFANYVGTKYAIGVSNGTDAIKLSLQALELKGSTGIIIQANTFIATILAAEMAYPEAFLELVDSDQYFEIDVELLEQRLASKRNNWKNCVIIPVHLYGQTCNMDTIIDIANKYNCYIIEDCSQAHGAEYSNGKKTGTAGITGAFSLYPGKNLGAMGDAGIITTNNEIIYEKLLHYRNLGSIEKYNHILKGGNHRLDNFQALILNYKLPFLDNWNKLRNNVASLYNKLIINKDVTKPEKAPYCNFHIYHIYCIMVDKRDEIVKYLYSKGIPTLIHYPIPIELSGAYKYLLLKNHKTQLESKKLLSLPMHPFLKKEHITYITETINNFNI